MGVESEPTELAVVAGRFVYRRELGRGGGGRVVLAEDRAGGSVRALKVVEPQAYASLAWELEAMKRVVHPAMARVFELLRLDSPVGAPFHLAAGSGVLVEEYVVGEKASAAVERFAPGDAARTRLAIAISHQVCRALCAAHGVGLLHGDIKPDNVLVRHGQAVLIDLGLSGPPIADGRVRGTPGFLAPEAWAGVRSVATEVYAVGATLHRLVVDAPGEPSVMSVGSSVELSALPDETPASLRALIAECLESAPAARPSSVRELADALAAIGAEVGLDLDLVDDEPSGAEKALCLESLPMVGRDAELSLLSDTLWRNEDVQVVGPAGAGRSRLIAEAVAQVQRRAASEGRAVPTYVRTASLHALPAHAAIIHLDSGVDAEAIARAHRYADIAGYPLSLVFETAAMMPSLNVVRVGPLSDAGLAHLVKSALGQAGKRRVDAASAVSGGLAGRLVRLLAESFRSGDDPRRAEVLARLGRGAAIAELPSGTEDLVERLAVAGGALGAGRLPEGASSAASTLRSAGLAAFDSEGRLRLRADVEQSVWSSLSPSRRAALAHGLEGDDRQAAPFCAAARGEPAEALFLGRIGEALDEGRLVEAERLARGGLSRLQSSSLAVALSKVHRAAGRYRDGIETLEGYSDPNAIAARADLLRRSGDREAAQVECERLVDPPPALVGWLALGRGELELAEKQAAGNTPEELEVRAWVCLSRGVPAQGEALLESALASASKHARARLQSSLGSMLKAQGRLEAAIAAYRYAAELASALCEEHLLAGAAANLAAVQLDLGALGPGMRSARTAAARLARMGRDRDLARALHNLVFASIWIGDFHQARALLEQAHAAAERSGDEQAQAYVALANAEIEAAAGHLGEARSHIENVRASAPADACRFVSARGVTLLSQAFDDLEGWLEADDRSFEAELARHRLSLCRGAPGAASLPEPRTWEERLRAALLAVDVAEAQGLDAEPARSRARSLLDVASRSLSPSQRRKLHAHPSYERALRALPASTESSGDDRRYRRLAELTKRLTAERRIERLREDIVDAAVELVGAERGYLVERVESGEFRLQAARGLGAEADAGLSKSIASRAIDGGRAVSAVDAMSDERLTQAASVHALALRSVLCVPLPQSSVAIYLDDRVRPAAFDEADTRLVADLAELGAIALDGAERLRAARQANLRLERLQQQLADEVDAQRAQIEALQRQQDDFVMRSSAMRKAVDLARRVARSTVPVLITGESGTGKERIARFVHQQSARAGAPFVVESCGALPDSLLESALFGHEKGAFTGADRTRLGLFEAADGGTLFLDEVGEMSAAMQAKLLRVVQEGEVRRVGGERVRGVDVRIIAATHRDLRKMVQSGEFREDLFYRIAVVEVVVPPLRERREDLALLASQLVAEHGQGQSLSQEALGLLLAAPWPGNVRQLENEMRRALVVASERIEPEHLSADLRESGPEPEKLDLKAQVSLLERKLIRDALDRTGGNQTQAAKLLGVSRFGLQKMLKRISSS